MTVTNYNVGGKGTGGGITDITYANLVTAIGGSSLVPGTTYRITDFATVHNICGPTGDRYDINTGSTEPLYVTALTTSVISKEARSALFPQDVIYYDWDPDNWLDDCSFSDDMGAIIAGFKGVIYFRWDTLLDNWLGYDFRAVKSRRWKTDADAWDSGTSYVRSDFVSHDGNVYIAKIPSTNQEPPNTIYWLPLWDLSVNEYWNALPDQWNGVPSDPASFIDCLTFVEGTGSATYELCVRSNHFGPFKDDQFDNEATGSLLTGNVFFLQDEEYYTVYGNEINAEFYFNTSGYYFYRNKIGGNFYYNTIGYDFDSNSIDGYFVHNTIGSDFYYNTCNAYFYFNYFSGTCWENSFGSEFQHNIIDNTFKFNAIGNKFEYNSIGTGFQANQIGNFFSSNIIGDDFRDNVIGNSFSGNTIGDSFNRNQIGNYFETWEIGDDFGSNVIGNDCSGNEVGDDFYQNVIGNNFNDNVIGNNFEQNQISSQFNNNTIGNECTSNVIAPGCNNLTIGNNFLINNVEAYIASVDFTAATHVYANTYNKRLFRRLDGTKKLSYINNSDALVVVAINA